MQNENFVTTLSEFDKAWIDQFGLVSGAYDWAIKELPPGHRVIGTRVLPFAGKLGIYKFDIRHHPEKGVTVECEIPARCQTVIRINSTMMIVQETESGEIVQKYLRFMDHGTPRWRLWHQRVYQYHIETTLPAVNFNIFLLQCNEVVRPLSKEISRDWFYDMKKQVMFTDMRANTPSAVIPLLKLLSDRVSEIFANPAMITKSQTGDNGDVTAIYRRFYLDLLEESMDFVVEHNGGRRHSTL